MDRQDLLLRIQPVLLVCLCVFTGAAFGDGGHGVGITFPANMDTTGGESVDFAAYKHSSDSRIGKDITALLSDNVQARIVGLGKDIQDIVDSLTKEIDYKQDNEFGIDAHDFALVYDYFSNDTLSYGQQAGEDPPNVLFRLYLGSTSYPDAQRGHVDYYLADWGSAEQPQGWSSQYPAPAPFLDLDEDPGEPVGRYYLNSLLGYDGPHGLEEDNPDWYKSGTASNLMFLHEYTHVCNFSNVTGAQGVPDPYWRWDDELLATAAEYLVGTRDNTYQWGSRYDFRYDGALRHVNSRDSLGSTYALKRLFAAYLLQQFAGDEDDMTDDLVYNWVRWPGSEGRTQMWPGMHYLAKELEQSRWDGKFPDSVTTGPARLRDMVQNWHIAKLVDNASLADGEYGFTRDLSPYHDLGLFRDNDVAAPNRGIIPPSDTLGSEAVDVLTWVDVLASDAESVRVPLYAADYLVFVPDGLESGGPYDLKVVLRGRPDNVTPAYWETEPPVRKTEIQVAYVTYDSAPDNLDSLFASGGQHVLEIRKLSPNPDSAKVNVTVHDFGGQVKAAVVVVSVAEEIPADTVDSHGRVGPMYVWNYKYGYTVEKHWKSGEIPWSATWFDSIHVNGDVTVGENKTVTIEPGTRVEFYPGDTEASGQDASRCELILPVSPIGQGGALVARGSSSEPVLFVSGATAPTNHDWYGVRHYSGCPAFEPVHCVFQNALYPVYCVGDTVVVDSCTFSSFWNAALYGSNAEVAIEDSKIDMSSLNYGVWVTGSSHGAVTGDSILCDSHTATYGVCGGTGSSLEVSENVISGPYVGIYTNGADLTCFGNTITGFEADGIKASSSTVSVDGETISLGDEGVRGIELLGTTSGAVSHNKITGPGNRLTYGIELKDSADPEVQYNWIQGVKYGIKMSAASSADISHNWIKGTTGNGIQCAGDAVPVLRYNTVDSLQGTAVTALDYAIPDLGASPDSGSNRIYQASSYYVANLTEYTVAAELNWWGSSSPSFRKFYGHVDYSPLCTSDPGTSYALPLALLPAAGPVVPYVTQNYPNPFNPRTTIEYGVSEPGTRVKVVVYDISGRVVRVLVDETRAAGQHIVVWDGRNERGGVVVSGVYVCDVSVGSLRQQKKLVVLR